MKYIPSSPYPVSGGSAVPRMVQRRRTFNIFTFIGMTMLVGSLAAAVGVFIYKNELEKRLVNVQAELKSVSNKDNDQKIADISAFDTKLKTAAVLLDNHKSPSRFLEELELVTKKSVQFTSFNYIYDPGFEAVLEMAGKTDELAGVALQKAKLLEEDLFDTLIVHNITIGTVDEDSSDGGSVQSQESEVSFGIKGTLRDEVIAYEGVQRSVRSADAVSNTIDESLDETGTSTSSVDSTIMGTSTVAQ